MSKSSVDDPHAPLPASARPDLGAEIHHEPPTPRRSRSGKWPIIVVALAMLAAAAALYKHRSARARSSIEPSPEVFMDGHRIRYSPAFASRHHITTLEVGKGQLSPTIQVNGTVQVDVRKFAAVGARSAGRVRRVFKIIGDHVHRGTVLADIESVELGRAQANAEALGAKEVAAVANLTRERQLAAAKVTAQREEELAEAEQHALHAERRAAEKAVAVLGAQTDGEVGILKLRSPIAGRVVEARARRGQIVETTDTLFDVADLSTVWIELRVFERYLGRIRVGDAVDIIPASASRTALAGTLAHVGSLVDPLSRTSVARVEVDNRQGLLRPGQSVSARIHCRNTGDDVIIVPKAGLTFVDGKPTVLLAAAPGLVEPHAIELGPDDGENAVAVQGLRAGDRIVATGVFALKSELFR